MPFKKLCTYMYAFMFMWGIQRITLGIILRNAATLFGASYLIGLEPPIRLSPSLSVYRCVSYGQKENGGRYFTKGRHKHKREARTVWKYNEAIFGKTKMYLFLLLLLLWLVVGVFVSFCFLLLFNLMCVSILPVLYVCTPHMFLVPVGSEEEGVRSCRARVKDNCELACGCWKLNPGPPKEQMFLTIEPSLKLHVSGSLEHMINNFQNWTQICLFPVFTSYKRWLNIFFHQIMGLSFS